MTARFLGLVKLSTEEATRMIDEGPVRRQNFITLLVQEAGGAVEGFWLTDVGDWDIVCLVDMHDETPGLGAAATLARRAAGLIESERWIRLAEPDDVAAALAMMSGTPG